MAQRIVLTTLAGQYADVRREKRKGRPLVGITCEYTPRELILAAGAMVLSSLSVIGNSRRLA